MRKINMKDVKEAGDFTRPDPGAYICTITDVKDIKSKEYLKVSYDIAEGEFKGYYGEMRSNNPDWTWAGAYVKSYKPAALPMFKRFCTAVSRSNGAFVFDGGEVNSNEKTLIGKKIGLLLGEEEYYGNDGEKKTRLYVNREFSIDNLKDQKVPKLKALKEEATTTSSIDDFVNVPEGSPEGTPFD
jgi:hypothetical protein